MRWLFAIGAALLGACSLAVTTDGLGGGAASSGGSSSGASGGSSASSGGASSSASSGGSSSSSSSSGQASSSSTSSSSGDAGVDAATSGILYSTGFEGTECAEWGGTKEAAGGRTGAGCKMCGGQLFKTLVLPTTPGTYVLEGWGRRVDPTPAIGWSARLKVAGKSADIDDELDTAYRKLSVEVVTTTTGASEDLRFLPISVGGGSCFMVDDVVFYRP
ncbi:MAG: hypothetical protein JNL38_08505 [Myxococcales bacterium]|nr:hypothetical protein [Myxococcales bacterium]